MCSINFNNTHSASAVGVALHDTNTQQPRQGQSLTICVHEDAANQHTDIAQLKLQSLKPSGQLG